MLCLFTGAISGCNSHTGPERHKPKYIVWDESRKLTWDDYKGPVPPNDKYDAASKVGMNCSDYIEDSTLIINISGYFKVDSSWAVKAKLTKNLLNHEQKHFDLLEVSIRQFRKYLSGWNGKGMKEFERFRILGGDLIPFFQVQDQYDSDTRHGLNRYQQEIWNRQIDSLLNAYKDYADTTVRVPWIAQYNSIDSMLKSNDEN